MFGSTLTAQPKLLPPPLMYSTHNFLAPPPPPPPLPPPPPPPLLKDSVMRVKNIHHASNLPYSMPSHNDWNQRRSKKTKIDKSSCETLNETPLQSDANSDINGTKIESVKLTTTNTVVASMANVDNHDIDELKVPPEMTKPLFCELCAAKLNGNLQANAHYEGKNHAKKVRQFLDQLRQSKGIKTPLPVVSNEKSNMKEKKVTKPLEAYCKLCDVAFTSEIQAKQHYNGRNHQRRLRGEPPLPKGFYNPATGKWQRQPPTGVPYFVQNQQKKTQKFSCESCNISVTSQEQLEAHLSGGKHKIQMSTQNHSLPSPSFQINGCS